MRVRLAGPRRASLAVRARIKCLVDREVWPSPPVVGRDQVQDQVSRLLAEVFELGLALDVDQRAELVPVVLVQTGALPLAGFCPARLAIHVAKNSLKELSLLAEVMELGCYDHGVLKFVA